MRTSTASLTRAARALPLTLATCALALQGCGGNGRAALPAEGFDSLRAWAHVEVLVGHGPRPSGSPELEVSRTYIAEQLRGLGLEPVRESFEDQTPIGKLSFTNVYADFPGKPRDGQPAPILILGAHYDTKRVDFPFVGANDNASGVAVLLELARVLVARGPARMGYRFLFLDGEEAINEQWNDPDNRYGSRHHAQALKRSGELKRFRAFILLDMVCDKQLVLMREENSNQRMLEAFFAAAREAGLGTHVDGRREPIRDDHLSFLEVGLESVDLIDFAYGPNNAWWHTRDDTLDKLARSSLEATGRIVLGGLPQVEALAEKGR